MRRAVRVTAILLAAVVVLGGCSDDDPGISFPGRARIDVDTPELRQIKKDAGIEPCRPGTGRTQLPDITLPCLGGGPDVPLTSLEGPLVVNLWGSWCGPCEAELPILAEFYRLYSDQVSLLGITVRDPQTMAALELARDSGVTYPLLTDDQDELPAKAPYPARIPVPSLTFVREDGSVEVVAGVIESVEELAELVETKLGIKL